MCVLISGSAASGKSAYARLLPERLAYADEMLAEDSDTRCAQLELWVHHALDAQ